MTSAEILALAALPVGLLARVSLELDALALTRLELEIERNHIALRTRPITSRR